MEVYGNRKDLFAVELLTLSGADGLHKHLPFMTGICNQTMMIMILQLTMNGDHKSRIQR